MSAYLFIYLSIYLFIYLSISLFICLSISLFIYFSICRSQFPSVKKKRIKKTPAKKIGKTKIKMQCKPTTQSVGSRSTNTSSQINRQNKNNCAMQNNIRVDKLTHSTTQCDTNVWNSMTLTIVRRTIIFSD